MGEANFHELTLQVNQFNRQYPPGTKVSVSIPHFKEEDKIIKTKVVHSAMIINKSHVIAHFEGKHGPFAANINRVKGKA